GVIRVAPAVVADGALLVVGQRVEVLEHFLDRLVSPLGALEGSVDLVDVGLVVLVVMHLHRGLVDVRLECVVVVRKRRYLVSHFGPFRGSLHPTSTSSPTKVPARWATGPEDDFTSSG